MVIRFVVMKYARFPRPLRNVEDLPFERGLDLCHETVRMWWGRFGPMFAGEILESYISKTRDKAAMSKLGNVGKQGIGRWAKRPR